MTLLLRLGTISLSAHLLDDVVVDHVVVIGGDGLHWSALAMIRGLLGEDVEGGRENKVVVLERLASITAMLAVVVVA